MPSANEKWLAEQKSSGALKTDCVCCTRDERWQARLLYVFVLIRREDFFVIIRLGLMKTLNTEIITNKIENSLDSLGWLANVVLLTRSVAQYFPPNFAFSVS